VKTIVHLDYCVVVEHNEISEKAQKSLLEVVAYGMDPTTIDNYIEDVVKMDQDPELFPEAISLQRELKEWSVEVLPTSKG